MVFKISTSRTSYTWRHAHCSFTYTYHITGWEDKKKERGRKVGIENIKEGRRRRGKKKGMDGGWERRKKK